MVPYDRTRIPGGSSGGTAAAVAAGMAPLGVGGDARGSIRVPAALCGIAGFRPTTFRYPPHGVVSLTSVFDTPGPLARTVADLALFDSVVTGNTEPLQAVSLRGVRLGVSRAYYYAGLDAEVERVINGALKRLTDAGAVLVEADVPDLTKVIDVADTPTWKDWGLVDAATFPIIWHQTVPMISRYLAEFDTGLTFDQFLAAMSPDVKAVVEKVALPGGDLYPPQEVYEAARSTYRPAVQRVFQDYFHSANVAAIVFPTTMVPATPIGEDQEVEIGGKKVEFVDAMSRNSAPGTCAGLPGLVLPAGLTHAGLPVGIEFAGLVGSDRDMLALGMALEAALGRIPGPQS